MPTTEAPPVSVRVTVDPDLDAERVEARVIAGGLLYASRRVVCCTASAMVDRDYMIQDAKCRCLLDLANALARELDKRPCP